jgi:biotin synthase
MTRKEIIDILKDDNFLEVIKSNSFINLINEKINYQNISWQGILNLSNYCCYDCLYCEQRFSNAEIERFRLDREGAIETAKLAAQQGMKSIIIESTADREIKSEMISYLIYSLKNSFDINLSLNIELFDKEALKAWKYAGADIFIIRNKKSFDRDYFASDSYEMSEDEINYIKSLNYKIGIANYIGAPFQTIENISDDLLATKEFNAEYVYLIPYPDKDQHFIKFSLSKKFEIIYKSFVILKILNKKIKVIFDDGIFKFEKNQFLDLLKLGCDGVISNITPDPYRKILANYRTLFYLQDLIEQLKQEQDFLSFRANNKL